MIRYSYNRQVVPPAPFIHVTRRCVETGQEIPRSPAQLDIAADRTVLPGSYVEELGLVPLDELPIGTFGGRYCSCLPIACRSAFTSFRR